MALELALVAPAFLAMLLLVVGFGRVAYGRQLVDQAAAAAARAASLTGAPTLATAAANTAATSALSRAGVSCRRSSVTVDTSAFRPGGQVAATVRCTADLSGLAIPGFPGTVSLDATAAAPLEPYRDLGTGS
jgi:Flp pilus assembly protein TadG